MTNKLLSVIIPVYNVEAYLERCLDSVCNQSYTNLEIICVDDGSTDGSAEILAKFAEKDSRIKVLTKRNGGLSSARNVGLTAATGEFVAFVDSDDFVNINAYEKAMMALIDERVDFVQFGVKVENAKTSKIDEILKIEKYFEPKFEGIQKVSATLVTNSTQVICDKIFRTSLIKENSLKFIENKKFADIAFFVSFVALAKWGFYIKEPLYHYVLRTNLENKELCQNDDSLDALSLLPQIQEFLKNTNAYNHNFFALVFERIFYDTVSRTSEADLSKVLKFASELAQGFKLPYKSNHTIWALCDEKYYRIHGLPCYKKIFGNKMFGVKYNYDKVALNLFGSEVKFNKELFNLSKPKKKLANILHRFKSPKFKRLNGFKRYSIVSAVYNVEKYLDEFIVSVLNQRLDFRRNIELIFVDDGSTDSSANIIQKYMKKYPKNISYIYKENGGQGSARNLGIQKATGDFVVFCDPDDFLDRDFFHKVDKFLKAHKDEDLKMIAANMIFYFENIDETKDTHPLRFKFKEDKILKIENLDKFIQLSVSSAFLDLKEIKKLNLTFKDIRPNFEDGFFISEYLMNFMNSKAAFLGGAKYYYRKRLDGTSSLDSKKDADLAQLNKNGYLLLLLLLAKQRLGFVPLWLQNVALYDTLWQIKDGIDKKAKFSELTNEQKDELWESYVRIYEHIDSKNIFAFNGLISSVWFFHKVGLVGALKGEQPTQQICYVDEFDAYRGEFCVRYFTPNETEFESVKFDGEDVIPVSQKTRIYKFLGRVFVYEKRLWFKATDAKKMSVKIANFDANITFEKKQSATLELAKVRAKFKKQANSLWLLLDKDYKADDNAEHLYRYVKEKHPEQRILFALRKESVDYERLKAEGFEMVLFDSDEFDEAYEKASCIISSHIDWYIVKRGLLGKSFVFLQHGVTKDDLSEWLNTKQIDIFVTTTPPEFESIGGERNAYKFGRRETLLSGFARHDALWVKSEAVRSLKREGVVRRANDFSNSDVEKFLANLENDKTRLRQKCILIAPTWRNYIAGTYSSDTAKRANDNEEQFKQSDYFKAWDAFLNSPRLKELADKFGYKVVYRGHPCVCVYDCFRVPDYVEMSPESQSYQELFCEANVMVSDYSSVAMEMGFLNKPVVYYQFDEKTFFSDHTLQPGYFDYRKNGFGPVCESETAVFDALESLLANECVVPEKFRANFDVFEKARDGKCCERIYKAVRTMERGESVFDAELGQKRAYEALDVGELDVALKRFARCEAGESEAEEFAKKLKEAFMQKCEVLNLQKVLLGGGYKEQLFEQFVKKCLSI